MILISIRAARYTGQMTNGKAVRACVSKWMALSEKPNYLSDFLPSVVMFHDMGCELAFNPLAHHYQRRQLYRMQLFAELPPAIVILSSR